MPRLEGNLISRSSLWTSLDCRNVEQTRAYLERSRISPLDVRLEEQERSRFLNDAVLLTVPHLGRLKSLTLSGSSNNLLQLTQYFGSPAPILEKLKLSFTCTVTPVIQHAIFAGNLSSLRRLRLSGVITSLTWTNLPNLVDIRPSSGSEQRVVCDSAPQLLQGSPSSAKSIYRVHSRTPPMRLPDE